MNYLNIKSLTTEKIVKRKVGMRKALQAAKRFMLRKTFSVTGYNRTIEMIETALKENERNIK